MGWLIGGIVALYLIVRSNAAAAVCVAPVTGGSQPVTLPQPCTIGPVHVSPSQSLICHATAVGCPTLPVPSTASEGTIAGGQPVNPLLPVQLANCNHTTPIKVAAPVIGNPGIVNPIIRPPVSTDPLPVCIATVFHCDHIVVGQQVIPTSSTPGQTLPTGPGQTILSTGTHTCGTGFKIVQDARGNTFQVNC